MARHEQGTQPPDTEAGVADAAPGEAREVAADEARGAVAGQAGDADSVAPAPAPSRSRAWRRLFLAGRPRATKANFLATSLAILLGFAVVAQVRQTSTQGLENLREDELVRVLDTVTQDGDRINAEIRNLEISRDRLRNDSTTLEEARQAAQDRLNALGILAGTVPAQGQGIVLTLTDPQRGITAPLLLDALQELRDAGAEAVQINEIRVVENTFFTDDEGGISVSGEPIAPPYVITAIGDKKTLGSAMDIPGGVSESVRRVGGEAMVDQRDKVLVSALHTVSDPQYARPVPLPSPTS
jgi:uncharacterized protein YlxW (UPF0749 family)